MPSSQLTPPQGSVVKWLVNDQLGSPRMAIDQTGSLARVTRHDYLRHLSLAAPEPDIILFEGVWIESPADATSPEGTQARP